MHFRTDRTTRTTAFDAPVVDHLLEQKIAHIAIAPTMQDQFVLQEDPNLCKLQESAPLSELHPAHPLIKISPTYKGMQGMCDAD